MSNIVTAYHGTRLNNVERILREGFKQSKNEYDWLGDGIYFFQDGLRHAENWSYNLYNKDAALFGVEIDLSDCLDLVDSGWVEFLKSVHDNLLAKLEEIPRQSSGAHRLDRMVINYAVDTLTKKGDKIRTVRAPFQEGDPIYPNSALYTKSHIQIAVRDVSAIKNFSYLPNNRS